MKLIDQCCTLEQAKRLKELGVKYPAGKESFFKWFECDTGEKWEPGLFRPDSGEFDYMLIDGLEGDYSDELETRGNWDAFTVAELGAMLPKVVKLADIQFRYGVMDDCHVQYIIQDSESDRILVYKGKQVWTTGKTEAECRAAMLIYLIENKLITVEEVNSRLCAE